MAGVSEFGGWGARLIFRLRWARPGLLLEDAFLLLFAMLEGGAGIAFGISFGETSEVIVTLSASLG